MRPIGLIAAGLVLALSAPALATGNVEIRQSDGSVQTYTGVILKGANKALSLTSADKVSTVVISGATCVHTAPIVRCSGGGFTFFQDGKTHAVPFKAARFYYNPTDQDQPLSLSAMTVTLAAHSVRFAILTAKGTHITGDGKLDQEPAQ